MTGEVDDNATGAASDVMVGLLDAVERGACGCSVGDHTAYRPGAGAAVTDDDALPARDAVPAEEVPKLPEMILRRFSSAAFFAAYISDSWRAWASAASLIAAKASRWAWMKASSSTESNMAAE